MKIYSAVIRALSNKLNANSHNEVFPSGGEGSRLNIFPLFTIKVFIIWLRKPKGWAPKTLFLWNRKVGRMVEAFMGNFIIILLLLGNLSAWDVVCFYTFIGEKVILEIENCSDYWLYKFELQIHSVSEW